MRLDEFQEEVVSRVVRYALPVTDEAGEEAYELLIVGREQQVRDALAESDIEVTIRPGVAEEEWKAEAERELSFNQVIPREAFDDPKSWVKSAPEPSAEAPVLVTLRATRPGGTGFVFRVTTLSLGAGAGITFMLGAGSLMSWAGAQVRPFTGDPDLFLFIAGGRPPGMPGIFSSAAPDGMWDTVWAQMLPGVPSPFVPLINVKGFTTTTTALLVWGWVI
jgi:hypothetical protein